MGSHFARGEVTNRYRESRLVRHYQASPYRQFNIVRVSSKGENSGVLFFHRLGLIKEDKARLVILGI